MHIEITYADGATETLGVTLEGHLTGNRMPGHLVEEPKREGASGADYFQMAMAGEERSGKVDGFDDEPGFEWKVVGTDEEESLHMVEKWVAVLGRAFDFDSSRVPAGVADHRRQEFLDDAQCMLFFLEEPQAEIDRTAAEVGLKPRQASTGPSPM